MKQDPENGKDAAPGAPVGAGGPSLLAGHRALIDRLFSESGAASWNLPRERFDSWRKLQRELRAIEIRYDARLRRDEKRKWQLRAREGRARARHR